MKAHFAQTGVEFFFHRYLIDSKKLNPQKRRKFQNEQEMTFSTTNFANSKTGLHKCRMVIIGQQNMQEWPLYLLKRVSYIAQKKEKKGKSYQVADSNIKKISQLRTEYLCYQIMSKSHRVVRMIEILNENPKKQADQQFFYKFLGRSKQVGVQNACFILELCNDGNLDDRINNYRNPLVEDNIISYSCQILQGLIQLKKKGVLHRDLRPCNIFLHNDEVKFGDFDSAFIYKQSQPSDVKSGIDINTAPQQIVELSALSDEQLQQIGNIKLFELQSKCDIYFFGMIIFKMIFKIEYEKKFQGTDIEYLIREKVKQGFGSAELLDVMKRCLVTNVEKRIDLVDLYDKIKNIQKLKYFNSQLKQRTYLSEDPLNLFSYHTLEPTEPQITTQIQNSISNTFTLSFVSVQYDFERDFQKATLYRSTKLYCQQVARVHSRFYKTQPNVSLWFPSTKSRSDLNRFLQLMQDFIIQMSTRAYYYDYLYKVILKINTKSIPKKQQKSIVTSNKNLMEKQLIIILKFLFEILSRTPFKMDKYYSEINLPYEARKLFKDKIKITNKYNFFMGRAKTFQYQQFDTYKVISQFFNINYEETDSQKFETIYENILFMISNIDQRLKKMLSNGIIDLFRPFQSSKKSKNSHLKEILFIMIALQKQKLSGTKKSNIVQMKQLFQPLFNASFALDLDQSQLFFQNYKSIHEKQYQESKRKQSLQLSFNLLSVSKKHLDCLFTLMKPFAQSQPLPELKEQENFAEQQAFQGESLSRQRQNKQATYTLQYDCEFNQINQDSDDTGYDFKRKEASPAKQQIQVKIFQQEESNTSEFEDSLQAANFKIMT